MFEKLRKICAKHHVVIQHCQGATFWAQHFLHFGRTA